jgi:hypothetical protein
MLTRRAENTLTITLVIIVGILTGSCRHYRPSIDGSRLDIRLTEAKSPEEIENIIKVSLAEKYLQEDMTDSYTMYHVSNGPTRWVFVKAYNAPRGLNMFNLYCYELERPDTWLLRGYIPVNAYYYTNSLDRELKIQTNNDYIEVVFRGRVVFTIASRKSVLEK